MPAAGAVFYPAPWWVVKGKVAPAPPAVRWHDAPAMPSVMTAFRDLERLRAIAVVLARHGFGEVLQRLGLDTLVPTAVDEATRTRSIGQRLRFVLQDLGPSFVKLGQIASTRADLIPADVIAELKVLQDDVKPVAQP